MKESVKLSILFSLSLLHFTVQHQAADKTAQCFDTNCCSRCANDEKWCSYTFFTPRPEGDTCLAMSATVRDMMRLQTESEGLKAMTVELQEQVKEMQSEKSVMRKELEKISAKAGKRKMIDDTIVYSRDGCLSSPCRYGGTCVEIGYGYRCLCRDGRKGNDCQIPPGKVAC
ncbi:venom prothrombin activator vestarin-D1-like [Ptychodera flava]|uniref:venom prothrombin activator vestarin-D1-like n=1 Tax=Ptychodera flava TaxID=63121 RepID=UPI00396A99DA